MAKMLIGVLQDRKFSLFNVPNEPVRALKLRALPSVLAPLAIDQQRNRGANRNGFMDGCVSSS